MLSISVFVPCLILLVFNCCTMQAQPYQVLPNNFMGDFENQMQTFSNNLQNSLQNMFGGNNYGQAPGVPNGNNWMKQHANPQIPVFPPNFPFPPQCRRIPDINGLRFPDIENNSNIIVNNYPPQPVTRTVIHETYECSDPRYHDSFYMLKSIMEVKSGEGNNINTSSSSQVLYYNKNGVEFNYEPEIKYRPLWN